MRVAFHEGWCVGETYIVKEAQGDASRLMSADLSARANRLDDLSSDREEGIERSEGVLEDD
jgi:hypothetical protein